MRIILRSRKQVEERERGRRLRKGESVATSEELLPAEEFSLDPADYFDEAD
jgi:hypothetical protein